MLLLKKGFSRQIFVFGIVGQETQKEIDKKNRFWLCMKLQKNAPVHGVQRSLRGRSTP